MKKPLLLSFMLLLSFCTYAQEWKRFTSQQHPYSLEVPASWQITTNFNKRIDFQALSPVEPSDKVRENVNAVVYTMKAPSLEEFYQVAKVAQAQQATEWALVSEGELTAADGSPVRYLINTHANGQSAQQMQAIAYFYYRQGTGIIVTCTAIPETFDAYRERFEHIARSFHWLP